MSPTKVLWISAAVIALGIVLNNVQVITTAMLAAIIATTAEVVFYCMNRNRTK